MTLIRRNLIGPSALVVLGVGLFCSFAAWPALAQAGLVADPAATALTQLVQTGIVGAFAVLEAVVIVSLHRQGVTERKERATEAAQERARYLELALKVTEALVENNGLMERLIGERTR